MTTTSDRLFYTMKLSHLSSLERELRSLRTQLNELHALESEAPSPEHAPLEALDASYLTLVASVQSLRASTVTRALPLEPPP